MFSEWLNIEVREAWAYRELMPGMHALITQVFFDVDDVILEHGGEVHRDIGDEVVITWLLADCRDDGRCLSCFQAIQTLIAERAEAYHQTFGVVPAFRAGLHGGPVVAGECGDSKQEIVYFGDTINTAARLRSACKGLGGIGSRDRSARERAA